MVEAICNKIRLDLYEFGNVDDFRNYLEDLEEELEFEEIKIESIR